MTGDASWIPLRSSRRTDIVLGALFVIVASSPILFSDRVFQVDMSNFMWMGSTMRHSLFHGVPPSYFLNANYADPANHYFNSTGVFNPIFAFYGGSLYAFFGFLIGVLGGSTTAAFDVLVVLAVSAAYGGSVWISRQCGITGLLAHVPAIVVVTAPYYLSNVYGRGDLPEFIALSMIPLVVAGATHLVRASSWTPGPTALFVVAVIFFTGSHNLTLLWGSLIGITVAIALAVVVPRHIPPITRLGAVGGVFVLATMVNVWYLLPDIAFSRTTEAAEQSPLLIGLLPYFDRFSLMFNPLRSVPKESGSPALFVQAPVWFLAFAIGCGLWIWLRHDGATALLRRTWTVLALLLVALFALRINARLFRRLPEMLQVIQFRYRLDGYVFLLTAGLVLVSVLAVQRRIIATARPFTASVAIASLVGVCTISLGLAIWQEWVPRSCPPPQSQPQCVANRTAGLTAPHVLPTTWGAGNYYTDTKTPLLAVAPNRSFEFSPELVNAHGDELIATVDLPSGTEPFVTNIMGGPDLVAIGGGIERLGRNDANYVVVRRVKDGDGPVRVVIRTAGSPAIPIGRWLSLLGIVGLALLLSMLAWRNRSRSSRVSARMPRDGAAA